MKLQQKVEETNETEIKKRLTNLQTNKFHAECVTMKDKEHKVSWNLGFNSLTSYLDSTNTFEVEVDENHAIVQKVSVHSNPNQNGNVLRYSEFGEINKPSVCMLVCKDCELIKSN